MKTTQNKISEMERTITSKIVNNSIRIIQVAPRQIMVNGWVIAYTYDEFKKWCNRHGLTSQMFDNWPFENRII